ncbi:hypothetical protein ACU5AX_06195 [Sphingomonas sp. XXL09]|uniref:hypothetical protein n=1 Tax=Sphingomonas sp. XXL09 TaxID=3457787 RepID=UPI00406BD966
MSDYRTDTDATVVHRRGGSGRIVAAIVGIIALIVIVLFATGFWSAKVTKTGSLPEVYVSTKGGSLPKVDLDSKKIVAGTKQTTVDVPKVETEKKSISVPVVGVTNGDTDKK